nr:glutamic acid-rich protein-like [Aedes albopictus]
MDSGKPNKSVKDSTSKDRRQKPKASAPEISANVDAMLAAEIDKLANVSTKAKSVVSNSSCKSALSLKLQMQKVLAEETLMLEEMKRRREFMKKKFELMEEIAEVQSCPVPGARTTGPLTKVKGWLQKQRQAENESVAADDDEHDSDEDEDDDAGDTESSSEYAADEEGDNSSSETEPESDDCEDDSSSAGESYHERGDEHQEERFSPRERSTPVHVRASRTSNREKHSRVSATLCAM